MKTCCRFSIRQTLLGFSIVCLLLFGLPKSQLARQDQTATRPETAAKDDLAKLYVSVSDKNGNFISKLNYYDFEVNCDKAPQQVSYFAKKDEPVGIVFLVDMSGSMRNMLSLPSSYRPRGFESGWKNTYQRLIATVPEFIENSHRMNEYSIILFNQQSWLTLGWTRDRQEIEKSLNLVFATQPLGQTSLYDSLVTAIEQAKRSSHSKRAVILLTDGVDSTSKTERSKLNAILQENDVPVYSVSLNHDLFSLKNHFSGTDTQKRLAEQFFTDLALMTGGTSFFPINQKELTLCLDKIAKELRNQYLIGFKPTCNHKPDKPHRVKVRLSEKSAFAAMSKTISIRHREEYKTSLAPSPSK
ncbi:MAG: VWA domain-containing protein [Acidobacteria bacterium]|nr:VWA domain-containing protein [Acidobacteriota bacterium]